MLVGTFKLILKQQIEETFTQNMEKTRVLEQQSSDSLKTLFLKVSMKIILDVEGLQYLSRWFKPSAHTFTRIPRVIEESGRRFKSSVL